MSGPEHLQELITDPGQPGDTTGSARSCFERRWMNWMCRLRRSCEKLRQSVQPCRSGASRIACATADLLRVGERHALAPVFGVSRSGQRLGETPLQVAQRAVGISKERAYVTQAPPRLQGEGSPAAVDVRAPAVKLASETTARTRSSNAGRRGTPLRGSSAHEPPSLGCP